MIQLWRAIGVHQTMHGMHDWDEDDYEIGIFTTEQGAIDAARNKGINNNNPDGKVLSFVAYAILEEKETLRKKAIDQLTNEQKLALGIE